MITEKALQVHLGEMGIVLIGVGIAIKFGLLLRWSYRRGSITLLPLHVMCPGTVSYRSPNATRGAPALLHTDLRPYSH
jgi:hypothetical protein